MKGFIVTLCVALSVALLAGCPGRGTPPKTPDAKPATLSVLVGMRSGQAVAVRRIEPKPDPISSATLRTTKEILAPGASPLLRHRHLRVRVLATDDRELALLFIDDPLSEWTEVPIGRDSQGRFDEAQKPARWVRVKQPVDSFLLAIPNIEGARWLELTRFNRDGSEEQVFRLELEEVREPSGGARPDTPEDAPTPPRPPPPPPPTTYSASDAEHATIIDNGPSGSMFDLLVLADGYQDSNADRDQFEQDVQGLLDYLWDIPIYFELRSAMNVHTAFVPSTDAGGGNGPASLKDTPFESFFNCNATARLVCQGSDGTTFSYEVALGAPGNYGGGSFDTIAVLVNDSRYGGSGGAILNVSSGSDSEEVFSHEFGHTVIDLADEYETQYTASAEVSARTKANISGPVAARNDLKWIGLVDPSTSIPTQRDSGTCTRESTCSTSTLPSGTAGMYEGGGYVACGSFRPTTECQMRCYPGFFCPVCQAAYRDTLGSAVPSVDVYMRDNSLDNGNTPSPSGVEDPPGSGYRVKPWHSVDIVVDAPPFGDPASPGPHENPKAGETNRLFVTVHNRGSGTAAVSSSVELFVAEATGGAPPFPGTSWTSLGTESASVPGGEGSDTVMFEWQAPINTPEHMCVIAQADSTADPLPTLTGSLSQIVRDNNNVTWKNLHVSGAATIAGDISNFAGFAMPIVFRIEAPDVPVGTRLTLDVAGRLSLKEFDPSDPRQMALVAQSATRFEFRRARAAQEWLALQTDLPPAIRDKPLRVSFSLGIQPPGGTTPGTPFTISVDQIAVEPDGRLVGDPVGGNTYRGTFN